MLKNITRLVLSMVLVFGFVACGGGSGKKTIYNEVDLSSFKIEFLEYGKVKIDWGAVDGAKYYEVKYYEFDKFLYSSDIPYTTVESPSIIIDGLTEGKWFISVKASNGKMETSPTFELTATSATMYDSKESENSTKITTKSISGKTFKITNLDGLTSSVVTFNNDKTITTVVGSPDYPFSKHLIWEVSKTGELRTISKVYGEDTVLETFIHKQTGYQDGCYIISTSQVDSNRWKNKYQLCPSSTDIEKTKKIVVVSGNYKESDWNDNFDYISVSPTNQWAEMIDSIPFYGKMIIDLGLESGTEEDKAKHKNPSSILLRWWVNNKAYLQLDFRDKDGYLLHTFKFNKSEGHNSAYIEFDGNRHNASDAELKSTIQGFIRVENGKFKFEGEYNTKVSNYIVGLAPKTWDISNFDSIATVYIKMGVLHTYSSEGEAHMPLYISY